MGDDWKDHADWGHALHDLRREILGLRAAGLAAWETHDAALELEFKIAAYGKKLHASSSKLEEASKVAAAALRLGCNLTQAFKVALEELTR